MSRDLGIPIHTGIAASASVFLGLATRSGLAFGGDVGNAIALAAGLLQIGQMVGWAMRERQQHGGRWGGLQSQLEWIVPDVVGGAIFLTMVLW